MHFSMHRLKDLVVRLSLKLLDTDFSRSYYNVYAILKWYIWLSKSREVGSRYHNWLTIHTSNYTNLNIFWLDIVTRICLETGKNGVMYAM